MRLPEPNSLALWAWVGGSHSPHFPYWTSETHRGNWGDQGEAVLREPQSRSSIPKSFLLNVKHLSHGICCLHLTRSQEIWYPLLVLAFYSEYAALHKSPVTSASTSETGTIVPMYPVGMPQMGMHISEDEWRTARKIFSPNNIFKYLFGTTLWSQADPSSALTSNLCWPQFAHL